MSYRITLANDNTTFVADENQTILQAAIDAGVRLPYGCNNGLCFGCLQEIDSGDTAYREPVTDVGDLLQYQTMICKAYAQSDVTLACAQLPDLNQHSAANSAANLAADNEDREMTSVTTSENRVQSAEPTAANSSVEFDDIRQISAINSGTFPAKVIANERLCDDICRVDLALPKHISFDFIAGQYIDVKLDNGECRSFSIADYDAKQQVMTLFIKRIENGFFTGYIFDYLTVNTIWTIEAPLGHFILRDNSRPIIMLGGSTGIAPLLTMLKVLQAENDPRAVFVYWGQQKPQQLYLHETLTELAANHEHWQYTPVLSRAGTEQWDGRHGYVQDAAIADLGDLSDYDIYISGSERLVNAAVEACLAAGAEPSAVYLDVFSFQSAV